ncbi:50S ribosomal protein L21 [Ostreibacterium oceani]|uniref:Large ribosomal subunit protein bL21 n=1 Tax=Ostreibacterium oceani TaxID=2654998 RepID=A0A6N7F2D7_9GAMM|nr:50S ribosomal protein L21 [Ostreibacterium oceani]MPV86036.1 50S ribosomal protein L21 [Ostreibacterium oceani]
MYAVIKTGGKQYRVETGQVIRIETIPGETGESVEFSDVLMVADGDDIRIGAPMLSDAKVTGQILEHARGKKIEIIKFKRRKHHMKRQGHRQNYTAVRIESIA